MKIHAIQHVPFETPGKILPWAKQKGYSITISHPYQGESLPAVNDFDLLVIMGGPQSASVLTRHQSPYLSAEIELIQHAMSANKKVLGFCLGAQLIGEALGAPTLESPEKEIGIFPIELTDSGQSDPHFRHLPRTLPVTHWHSEMPGYMNEASILARSVGCPHQAFSVGENIYGLQFHLEIEKEGLLKLIEYSKEDLVEGPFIQTPAQMLGTDFSKMHERLVTFLDSFTEDCP